MVQRQILDDAARIQEKYTGKAFISFEQGLENALYFAEEVMPAIDRKKNIRVRDRATMTNLILGLNGYTVASGALSRELNGPDVIAIPLKMDDFIRVGLIRRSGVALSSAGATFVRVIKSYSALRKTKQSCNMGGDFATRQP